MEAVTDFIFLDSKITVNSDFRHEIKGRLLLGRKPMTNLDSILNSRDTTYFVVEQSKMGLNKISLGCKFFFSLSFYFA